MATISFIYAGGLNTRQNLARLFACATEGTPVAVIDGRSLRPASLREGIFSLAAKAVRFVARPPARDERVLAEYHLRDVTPQKVGEIVCILSSSGHVIHLINDDGTKCAVQREFSGCSGFSLEVGRGAVRTVRALGVPDTRKGKVNPHQTGHTGSFDESTRAYSPPKAEVK